MSSAHICSMHGACAELTQHCSSSRASIWWRSKEMLLPLRSLPTKGRQKQTQPNRKYWAYFKYLAYQLNERTNKHTNRNWPVVAALNCYFCLLPHSTRILASVQPSAYLSFPAMVPNSFRNCLFCPINLVNPILSFHIQLKCHCLHDAFFFSLQI